jgi:SAM-dependent methyltransferase
LSIPVAAMNLAGKYCRRASRRLLYGVGSLVFAPHRCPGCGGWRKRRRLAVCLGELSPSLLRRGIFATGCPRCGLLFASPRPSDDQLQRWYSESGSWATTHGADEPDRRRPLVRKHLIAAIDEITDVCTPPSGSRALDFGCGNGKWLDTLKEYGWDTFGIDPGLKTAFRRHAELREVPAATEFRFVVLSHVLEHVTEPASLLTQLARATVPGGWIFVAVPSIDRLPEHGDWFYVLNARAHVAAYSVDCLTTLLGRAGFGDVRVLPVQRGSDTSLRRLWLLAQRGAPMRQVRRPLQSALAALASVKGVAPTRDTRS